MVEVIKVENLSERGVIAATVALYLPRLDKTARHCISYRDPENIPEAGLLVGLRSKAPLCTVLFAES